MKSTIECYNKVNKDCFKFIESQETIKEKFKNKEKTIKSFLVPISFWIASKAKNKKPFIVGLGGGQGTGKTTITSIISIVLKKYFKFNVFKISIDDFYKTRKERILLSKKVHPLLITRGVPGTHDVSSMFNFFKRAKSKNFRALKLPKFNKAIDDRYNKKLWYSVKKKPDIIIFEGWCVGARVEKNNSLKKAINSLERNNDKKLIWRKFVNQQLKLKYKKLYTQLDCLLFLKANNFRLLQQWRLKQEKKLWLKNKRSRNNRIMNKKDVIKFMQTYQRITQNMLKHAPKYSSMILNLNRNHQIKSVKYKL
ncbi:uridine kinase [Candidatus Pelagibacter sp.]|nr:uridine kinase [Candidatus Pelagibacter sp.]